MESYFSFSEPLNSGIDFYRADDYVTITSSIDVTSNASANIIKTAFAQINISGALDATLNAVFERQDALSNIEISSDVVVSITKFAHSASNITGSTVVSTDIEKIALASSAQSGDVVASFNSEKIAFSVSAINDSSVNATTSIVKTARAVVNISGLLDVVLLAVFERQDGTVTIASDVNVAVGMQKIAFGELDESTGATESGITTNVTKIAISDSAVSGDVTLANTLIAKEARAVSALSAQSDFVSVIGKISFLNAALSGTVNLTTAGRIFLATIRINVLNNTNITASSIRFSANVISDNTIIRNLLLLDNKSLTNQTRTFAINATPRFIQNVNWQGDTSRYYKNTAASKGAKRTFNLDWSFIPNEASFTVDLRESRNFLKEIAQDSDVHTLTIINQDVNGVTPYTEDDIDVFITSYSETLIRRDLPGESYYFSCNMVLEEA
jgi:hypothetical protein